MKAPKNPEHMTNAFARVVDTKLSGRGRSYEEGTKMCVGVVDVA